MMHGVQGKPLLGVKVNTCDLGHQFKIVVTVAPILVCGMNSVFTHKDANDRAVCIGTSRHYT